jgi:hypothetical protein
MSRNGSGVYTLPAGNPVVTLTQISSTWANNTLSDIATEITNSIDKSGRTVPTANLPMAGYKHTGAGAAAAAGQYVTFNQTGAQFPAMGIGVAPTSWTASHSVIDLGAVAAISGSSLATGLYRNSYYDGTNYRAKVTGAGMLLYMTDGLTLYTMASVSAGAVQTLVNQFSIQASGAAAFAGALAVGGALSAANLLSGTYTPTVANQSNITSVSVEVAQYLRVGNVVTVSGQCTITPASAASATFSLSLPIAVTGLVGETHKVAGVMAVPGADLTVRVRGSGLAATQVAWLQDTYPGTSGYVASYHFTYLLE